MVHWCADESAQVVTLLSFLPFAWTWLRAKARRLLEKRSGE